MTSRTAANRSPAPSCSLPPALRTQYRFVMFLGTILGNAQIAVIAGLFEHETYDWRSMTTPGITGLFNKNCLTSAADNLIMCAPGDNTYDGVQTNVSLISSVSQFHSLYTTEEEVGEQGLILPRGVSEISLKEGHEPRSGCGIFSSSLDPVAVLNVSSFPIFTLDVTVQGTHVTSFSLSAAANVRHCRAVPYAILQALKDSRLCRVSRPLFTTTASLPM